MNDLVVLSLNVANQLAVNQTAVVPHNPNEHPNGSGFSNHHGSSDQHHSAPAPYSPDLINPNIPYPQLVGAAGDFSPYQHLEGPAGSSLEPSASTPYPNAYEAVSDIYDNASHAGDWVVGTTLNLEI